MLHGALKAMVLLNVEPALDSVLAGKKSTKPFVDAELVVTLSPFKTNLDCSDVLLPIAPFSETSGSFVNAEGRIQSFHAVVRPLGEARPAWKVIRVLANLLSLPGFEQSSSEEVLNALSGQERREEAQWVQAALLSNATCAPIVAAQVLPDPVVAAIYQLDGLVRRAPSLQATADAQRAMGQQEVAT
jgi:NADH-quinone oxidoreductase subunit G